MADMELPPPEQIKEMLDAGVPIETVREFIRRGNFRAALDNTRRRTGSLGAYQAQGDTRTQIGGKIGLDINPTAMLQSLAPGGFSVGGAVQGLFGGNPNSRKIGGIPQRKGSTSVGGGVGSGLSLSGGRKSGGGGLGSMLGSGGLAALGKSLGGGLGGGTGMQQQEQPQPDMSMPDVGSPPQFQQPSFNINDFTGEANSIAAQIYGPQYAAIDQAKQGAQGQYQRSDQALEKLYSNLVDSIAQRQVQTAQQYADAGAKSAASTDALAGQIGQTYNASQQQQADMMAKLGIQEAAPDTLDRGTEDSAYQQSQARIQGANQQGALQTMGQGQADYAKNLQNAEQTTGVASRESLLNDLGQILAQFDQQKLGLQSDQGSAAMEIANRMTDRDLQLQQMNYGGYRDAFDAAQGQYDNASERALADRNFQYGVSQDNRQQANTDRDYQFGVSKLATDLATEQSKMEMERAKLGSAKPIDPSNMDPVSSAIARHNNANDTDDGSEYFDAIDQFVRQLASSGISFEERYAANPQRFVLEASDFAAKHGLNPRAAQSMAQMYLQLQGK